jgi:hypothetical protein
MPIKGMTVEGLMSFFVTNDLNPQPISRIQHDLKNTALKDWVGLNRLPKSTRAGEAFGATPCLNSGACDKYRREMKKLGNGKEKELHPFTDKDKETTALEAVNWHHDHSISTKKKLIYYW